MWCIRHFGSWFSSEQSLAAEKRSRAIGIQPSDDCIEIAYKAIVSLTYQCKSPGFVVIAWEVNVYLQDNDTAEAGIANVWVWFCAFACHSKIWTCHDAAAKPGMKMTPSQKGLKGDEPRNIGPRYSTALRLMLLCKSLHGERGTFISGCGPGELRDEQDLHLLYITSSNHHSVGAKRRHTNANRMRHKVQWVTSNGDKQVGRVGVQVLSTIEQNWWIKTVQSIEVANPLWL